MGKVVTVRTDKGLARLLAAVKRMQGQPFSKIGIMGSQQVEGAEFNMASLATVHEFGSTDGNIPERSFMRLTMTGQKARFLEMNKRLIGSIASGKRTPKQALGTAGEVIAAAMKEQISKGIDPKNADATILRKKSSTPLIADGDMQRAITHVEVGV